MIVKRPTLSLLKKIFLVDLIRGLFLTFSYQRPSKNYTEQYPKVRPKVSERYRGARRDWIDANRGIFFYLGAGVAAIGVDHHGNLSRDLGGIVGYDFGERDFVQVVVAEGARVGKVVSAMETV